MTDVARVSLAFVVDAVIERKDSSLPRFVVVSSERVAVWNLDGTTVIEGTIDGAALGRRTIKPWDKTRTRWFVDLPQALCRRIGVDTGDRVRLDLRVASTALPDELRSLLEGDSRAHAAWQRLTPGRQRMLREHVAAAKRQETRRRRAARALVGAD